MFEKKLFFLALFLAVWAFMHAKHGDSTQQKYCCPPVDAPEVPHPDVFQEEHSSKDNKHDCHAYFAFIATHIITPGSQEAMTI